MPYGQIKVDTVTFTNDGVDKTITVSGIVASISGNLTVTGTVSGDVVRGGTTVSGATVTGTAGQFGTITGNTAGFTTVTGTTVTGTTANFVSGVFQNISGGTHTITSGVFASGTAAAPSITFTSDLDTGIYNSAANQVSITTSGTERLRVDATGQIESVSLGTAAAPAYSFTTDPDTGLYSPAANEVALATNGSGRLFVDSSGRVGIGTSAPGELLHLASGSSPAIRIKNTTGGVGSFSQLQLATANTFDEGRVVLKGISENLGNNAVAFAVETSAGAASPTEKLRITSAGLVGVGTSAPDQRLVVAGNVTVGENSSSGYSHLYFLSGTSGSARYGRISKNYDSPFDLRITASNSTGAAPICFDTYSGNEVARFDTSGRLGIGTASPSTTWTQTNQSTATIAAGVAFFDSAGVSRGQVGLGGAATGSSALQLYLNGSDNIALSTGGTEAVRIDSSRRLLVGTSTARANFFNSTLSAAFQIEGTGTGRRAAIIGDDGASYVVLARQNSGAVGGNTIVANQDNIGEISFQGNDGTEFVECAAISCQVDGAPGANDMPGRLVFSTTADGAATPTERMRITSAGLVGVGTSSPGTTLDVSGTIRANTAIVTLLTNGILQSREFGGNSANNTIEYSIRPSAGKSGYLTFTEDAVADRWSIGIQNGSDGLRFISGTPTSGTERARIDGSGRLLVGTSSAINSQKLQIAGDNNQASFLGFNGSNANGPMLSFYRSRSSTTGTNTIVQNNDETGSVDFFGADGTNYIRTASIASNVDGTPGANDMPGRLVFSTTKDGQSSSTSRFEISNLGIGAIISENDGLNITSTTAAGTANVLVKGFHSGTAGTKYSGTNSFSVFTNGNVQNTNNSYGSLSDIKLKENIVDATSQWSDIKALQVRKYNFKEGQTHTQIGLIAQEVEFVSPGLVSESPDRDAEGNDLGTVTKSVNYSVLYMKAVKALQEAMERIETLEAKVAALESA